MKTTGKTKILAMVISLMMIVATFPMGMITVSAEPTATVNPQGQAISSAEQFADMSDDGTYYLAADIELSETYATTFKGTFDGNGRTIKTSVPVFNRLEDATVGNFTVNPVTEETAITLPDGIGVLNTDEMDGSRSGYVCGAVACMAVNSTIHDVVNNADVTNTNESGTITAAAGILGFMIDSSKNVTTIAIRNCVNNGKITTTQTDGWRQAAGMVSGVNAKSKNLIIEIEGCDNNGAVFGGKGAGMVAYIQHIGGVSITDCTNTKNGTITGSSTELAGGILAHTAGTLGYVNVIGCNNSASVSANKSGGIIGQLNGTKAEIANCLNSGEVTGAEPGGILNCGNGNDKIISNCHNTGNIYHNGAKLYAGGIVARLNGGAVEFCSNSGNLYVVDGSNGPEYAGGIAGWLSGTNEIRYCYNTGDIVKAGYKYVGGICGIGQAPVYGCYNIGKVEGKPNGSDTLYIGQISGIHNKSSLKVENNYYLDGVNDLPAYSANKSDFTYDESKTDWFTGEELASGALALAMNTAIGKTVYYQNINEGGATNDDYPVTDPTHGYVFDEDMDKELENGETLYSLAFFTLDGAGIRLDPVNHGIRFSTAVSKADYDVLTKAGITLDFGTIITPDEYLAAADNNFKALAEGKYLDVNSEATGIGVFREVKGEDNATYYFFCGSITGIKAANYDWDYSAIGYVTINGNTVYSANYTTRNAAYVANAAINDPNGEYSVTELDILRGYLQ